MPVITLTTDWGMKDHHVGALKGDLLRLCQQAVIADISHEVHPFDITEGAFLFRHAYHHFPEETIHFVAINTQSSSPAAPLALQCENHFFIGLDDGFFSLVFEEKPVHAVYLPGSGKPGASYDLEAMIHATVHLAAGKPFSELGTTATTLVKKLQLQPVMEENLVKGTIIYLDRHENAVTNISKSHIERAGKGRPMRIFLRKGDYHLDRISDHYQDEKRGNIVAVFNSDGLLEIALNQGGAAGLLGISYGDIIRIEFM